MSAFAGGPADAERLVRDGGDPVRQRLARAGSGRRGDCRGRAAAGDRAARARAGRTTDASAASGVSTFSRMPVLLPPFSGPRNTASATPSHRHITPKVWHTASSTASSSARIAIEQAEQRRFPARDPRGCPASRATRRRSSPDPDGPVRPCRRRSRDGPPGGLRNLRAPANVVGEDPEPQAGRRQIGLQVADRVLHPVHDARRVRGWASRGACRAPRRR